MPVMATTEGLPVRTKMSIDSVKVAPTESTFIDSLPDLMRSIAKGTIPSEEAAEMSPSAVRADILEIRLRSHLLTLLKDSIAGKPSLERVGAFWKLSLELCLHLVFFCEEGSDPRYAGMSVRKLPLLLLEDALDSLPIDQFRVLWQDTVVPSFSMLFSDTMWSPSPNNHPCSLPFIKLCNKFLRRLEKGPLSGEILLTLASAFPLNDKSATKIWGSFNTDNMTEFESEQEYQKQEETRRKQENDSTATYSFYESFWSIQQSLSNPTSIKVAEFLQNMRTILAALESHPINSKPSYLAPSSKNFYDKYLTSSHLLPIQICDSSFRINFLTQFLVIEKHLSSESHALGNALESLQKRAKTLIKNIQPHGANHLSVLEFILNERETHWRQWKKNKCQPALERTARSESEAKSRKRLIDGPLSDPPVNEEEEDLFNFIDQKTDLMTLCSQKRRKIVPSLDDHMSNYVDALDPESGIEAEYHPKNDSLFTWRAIRLLSKNHLGRFGMISSTGDFEKMARQIYKDEKGIDIPGEAPVEPIMEASEDEDDQDKDKDMEMIAVVEDAPVPGKDASNESPSPKEEDERETSNLEEQTLSEDAPVDHKRDADTEMEETQNVVEESHVEDKDGSDDGEIDEEEVRDANPAPVSSNVAARNAIVHNSRKENSHPSRDLGKERTGHSQDVKQDHYKERGGRQERNPPRSGRQPSPQQSRAHGSMESHGGSRRVDPQKGYSNDERPYNRAPPGRHRTGIPEDRDAERMPHRDNGSRGPVGGGRRGLEPPQRKDDRRDDRKNERWNERRGGGGGSGGGRRDERHTDRRGERRGGGHDGRPRRGNR